MQGITLDAADLSHHSLKFKMYEEKAAPVEQQQK